jgi:tetratricopeptide (TPR) repeat protein
MIQKRYTRAGLLAIACAFLLAAPGHAIDTADPADRMPRHEGEVLPDPETTERGADISPGEQLRDLYRKLREAPTKESAQPIAQAVERLWLSSGSFTIDLLMSRAMEAIREKDYDRALLLLDQVVAAAPEHAEGWNQRALVHFLRKSYGASMRDLGRVLALDPYHYNALRGLATILSDFGRKEHALAAYRQALQVNPHLDDVRKLVEELSREIRGQDL